MFVHYSFLSATTQAISDERGFGSFRFTADDNNDQKSNCHGKNFIANNISKLYVLLRLFIKTTRLSMKTTGVCQ